MNVEAQKKIRRSYRKRSVYTIGSQCSTVPMGHGPDQTNSNVLKFGMHIPLPLRPVQLPFSVPHSYLSQAGTVVRGRRYFWDPQNYESKFIPSWKNILLKVQRPVMKMIPTIPPKSIDTLSGFRGFWDFWGLGLDCFVLTTQILHSDFLTSLPPRAWIDLRIGPQPRDKLYREVEELYHKAPPTPNRENRNSNLNKRRRINPTTSGWRRHLKRS